MLAVFKKRGDHQMLTVQVKSDIMYVCALIEHVGRLTHNRNRDIAEIMKVEGIAWQLKHAQTSPLFNP